MENTSESNIFVHLSVIDEISWKDGCINTNTILIVPTRDDTFNIRSKNKQFKHVAHLKNYEFDEKYIKIMEENEIEIIILLPLKNYNELSLQLINEGYAVKILEMSTNDILNTNFNNITKYINRSEDYYSHWFQQLSTKNDFLANPIRLENEITSLIHKLNINTLNHIPFNSWLIRMIQLDNGCSEPLIFNVIKNSMIKYAIENGE